jgi:hypothetical protein
MDYYQLVKTITPGRCPSVQYVEHKQIWGEFTYAPIYSIHTATFWKVHARRDTVDLRKEGRLDYWVRIGSTYCPASFSCQLNTIGLVSDITYYFYNGLFVESKMDSSMIEIKAPDKEMFDYCLSAFLKHYLSDKYSLNSYWKGVLLQSSDLLIS